ncbi:MAG TPA: Plug domain-containing protein [Gemmatimonadales bacterium]|nr:Plug domain-containing protein [Gemmatimonadales bacterium]
MWSRLPLLCGLVCLGACAHMHGTRDSVPSSGDRIFITQEQIARSGASNAWEALKRNAPQLTYREGRNGQPTVLERRGRSSLLLNDAPLLFVDGVQMPDFKNLQSIPAAQLASIEILDGVDGTTYYGTGAEGGVILIRTKNGS